MKRSSWQLLYVVLGTAFAVLGALSFLNVAAAWQTGGVFLLGAASYGLMDLIIAYGLFTREWWVPYAFLLNLAGLAALYGTTLLMHGAEAVDPVFYTIALGVNAALAAFLYYTRARRKKASSLGDGAGAAFAVLWAVMFCYTIVGSFS
jgi:uncharacterized membrane protein